MAISKFLKLTLILAFTALLFAPSTEAREAKRTFKRGGVAEKSVTRNEDGSAAIKKSYTGPNGKTGSVDKTRTKTENGYSTTGTRTGPNGKTQTFERSSEKTENGRSFSGTTTLENGKTITTKSDVTRTENGRTRTTTQTGPNGNTRTFTTNRLNNQ